MSTYLSGGLTMILIAALLAFSVQVGGIYHTTRAVDASLELAEMEMGLQGCVSSRAISLIRERLLREGLDPQRLTMRQNIGPGMPRAIWGGEVHLWVQYEEPHPLLHNFATTTFDLVVERRIATISGWVRSTNGNDICP